MYTTKISIEEMERDAIEVKRLIDEYEPLRQRANTADGLANDDEDRMDRKEQAMDQIAAHYGLNILHEDLLDFLQVRILQEQYGLLLKEKNAGSSTVDRQMQSKLQQLRAFSQKHGSGDPLGPGLVDAITHQKRQQLIA